MQKGALLLLFFIKCYSGVEIRENELGGALATSGGGGGGGGAFGGGGCGEKS
jgi:hypothetical protein